MPELLETKPTAFPRRWFFEAGEVEVWTGTRWVRAFQLEDGLMLPDDSLGEVVKELKHKIGGDDVQIKK